MLILKLVNNEPFAPGELYDALSKTGGNGYELDAGLGTACFKETFKAIL